MITLDDLRELQKRVKDSGLESTTAPSDNSHCLWLDMCDHPLYADCNNEHSDACFALLDLMEAAGRIPQLNRSTAFHEMREGFVCQDLIECCFGAGTTRTEAIVKLFNSLMPVLEKE